MIVFPESWHRERDERLAAYYAKDRAARAEWLRHRLRTRPPGGWEPPGDITPHLESHAQTLAAVLTQSAIRREDYADSNALLAALILHAPLPGIGAKAIGLLSLRSADFAKVVETFDRLRADGVLAQTP